ncbi:pyridoxal-phosphate dependent enzyme [Rapidithrix thailandica]|uniref:Pyridoxal-phosphate dependent enzyme n=1 Tax=Rapidithrix thailandica TaxID=413964 RepID=A0AAW9S1D8_9BACT
MDLLNTTTKIQEINDPEITQRGIRLLVKRDDLIHPQISGNKWRKLKYNLLEAQRLGHKTLLTFGGAYSNHIYATAAVGKLFGLRTIGIIRGEEHLPLNSTLAFAKEAGMQLHYMDRSTYRQKQQPEVIQTLQKEFGPFYLVPEGGSNALAVKGCSEILEEIDREFDYICCPCGTGGTLAGVIAGLKGEKKALGFAVLKGAHFLTDEVKHLLLAYQATPYSNWDIHLDYHFGGYAKSKPELEAFIQKFTRQHHIPLEFVYSGKMFFGIYDLIQKGYFARGTTLLAVHTGGLRTEQE